MPARGNISVIAQSGAVCTVILDWAKGRHLGVGKLVSMGNKADVSANDLLLYWEGDPSTDVILLYLESFGHPRRFARISRRVNHKKPIVVVKSGRSQAGARAASSHTGSMASGEVAAGNLAHRLPEEGNDELASTARAFNMMTAQGLKPPTHSANGLPKSESQPGYAAVYDLLKVHVLFILASI